MLLARRAFEINEIVKRCGENLGVSRKPWAAVVDKNALKSGKIAMRSGFDLMLTYAKIVLLLGISASEVIKNVKAAGGFVSDDFSNVHKVPWFITSGLFRFTLWIRL